MSSRVLRKQKIQLGGTLPQRLSYMSYVIAGIERNEARDCRYTMFGADLPRVGLI